MWIEQMQIPKGGMRVSDQYILEMRGITKVYPNGFIANKDVNLAVREGEIHALVGENGAGKSTLMKVLFGVESHEEGEILLHGSQVRITDPISAIDMGIGMVHQHFMLVPSLTVAENIVLGREPKKYGALVDMETAVRETSEICERYNLKVDPTARVDSLPVGQKQKVEILKALYRKAKVLILDEPTAVLTPQETEELFVELKRMREAGHTIIFISHKLNEVKELCDRVTVLRLGRTIGTADLEGLSEQQISRMMVGRDVILKIQKEKVHPKKEILAIRDLSLNSDDGRPIIRNLSFSVRSGEILGVAGVEGNGQRELSEIITGLRAFSHGEIKIEGVSIAGKTVKDIRRMGVSHISEDRMTYGVAANAGISENVISDRFDQPEYCKKGFLQGKAIEELTRQLIGEFHIKCDDGMQPIRMLSGGNMQKVVAAREFSLAPHLSIVNQPTRGIDVGATEFVRNKIVELRDKGTAVLLISADLNEILELSDSLIVMHGGEIVAYLPDSSQVTESELGEYMLGIRKQKQEEIRRVCHEYKTN